MTQADDRILETLAETQLVLSPRVLAVNIDYTRHYISARLRILAEAGLVERVEEGLYRITESGEAYLAGELSAKDLE